MAGPPIGRGAKVGAKRYPCVMSKRGFGEDGIYFDHLAECQDHLHHKSCRGRWRGAISLGYGLDGKRLRRKVSGATKQEVRDKLKKLHEELDDGLRSSARYTVAQAIADWLREGLDGRSAGTVELNKNLLGPVSDAIGHITLKTLTSSHVREALSRIAATRSTRTVVLTHNALDRVIRHAEANDLVRRNVVSFIRPPRGQDGRPSKSLTPGQAAALLEAAGKSTIGCYTVLCLTVGLRTEEARALTWDHVDLDGDANASPPLPPRVEVWRSVRERGDTKTQKSRRTLQLPEIAADALRSHKGRQAAKRLLAGVFWQDTGLVFCTSAGTPLAAGNIRRSFKKLTQAAGLGADWTPRELRTSFVSLMSNSGTSVEEIARIVGHSSSRTTETVYRQELRPVITTGAETMDKIFAG